MRRREMTVSLYRITRSLSTIFAMYPLGTRSAPQASSSNDRGDIAPPLLRLTDLSEAQRTGKACVICDKRSGTHGFKQVGQLANGHALIVCRDHEAI